jgi:hypothetical protein
VVAVRLDGEQVAGEQDEVGLGAHGALADPAQPPLRHERPEVRIGDLH